MGGQPSLATARDRWSGTRPRTASMPRRPCWPGVSPGDANQPLKSRFADLTWSCRDSVSEGFAVVITHHVACALHIAELQAVVDRAAVVWDRPWTLIDTIIRPASGVDLIKMKHSLLIRDHADRKIVAA